MKRNPPLLLVFVSIALVLQVGLVTGASARAITRGYATTDAGIRSGMVVSSAESNAAAPSVVRATIATQAKVIGVATDISTSLVTVADAESQVYIENEGTVEAFVSNVNGAPRKGDLLGLSPINGVLMKVADTSQVIAAAQTDFSETLATTYTLAGSAKPVLVEKLAVNLDVKGNTAQSLHQRSALSNIGKTITGREVSDLRIMVSLAVFFIVMLTEGAILYGAITSAVGALGRNPLARSAIQYELFRVAIIAISVLVVGTLAVYALLWI